MGPRVAIAMLVALLAGCGSEVRDCACTITIDEFSKTLGCGDEDCVAGSRFGCDDDNVVSLGKCFPPDLGPGDGGACFVLQATCTPGASACCADVDLGVAPTCDPVGRRCCVPTGAMCGSSTDCCEGHPCVASADGRRCAP